MLTRHSLLDRQVRKAFARGLPADAARKVFLGLVNDAYHEQDADRRLLEQSLDVVSEELTQRNQELLKQLRERERMEIELNHALKLEAVGQLASGIAHEINTPIQYIGDSVAYVHDTLGDVRTLLDWYQRVLQKALADGTLPTSSELLAAEERADITYAMEQIPLATERALDGVHRVATLVQAMKEFAHPDASEMALADINAALRSTMLVAGNEIRRVAELVIELDALPEVSCHIGEINQVFLNLLVNAAHAVGDAGSQRGCITVRSRVIPDGVEISVADTGRGIPAGIRSRIFEPFFTTKDVGRGTGQGLAIALSIVRDKHAGSIHFQTEEGVGTIFVVRLPLKSISMRSEATAA
ncbi:MAG: sensor histidine kinase [Phycisphaerae bacterium]|nr:sensor histidine kinase [Gemmatimonadaceae bacterium]